MKKYYLSISAILTLAVQSYAQTQGIDRGAQVVSSVTNSLERYIDPVSQLLYIVAAITALVGAYKVFAEWNGGNKSNVMQNAWGWLGSCLFLLSVNAVLRAMFIA